MSEYFRSSTRRSDHETIMDPIDVVDDGSSADVAESVAESAQVKAALALLSDSDRDVLLLAAWTVSPPQNWRPYCRSNLPQHVSVYIAPVSGSRKHYTL
ncbi:MAG: hypothetical protein U1U88_001632 [Lawsonella clevelandensis]